MTDWSQRAAAILARAGYSDISYIEGGVAGWEKAGFVTFSGVHVPSKAFGEFVEHDSGTPNDQRQRARRADALWRQAKGARQPAVRRIHARLDSLGHQRARRRAGAARARYRALARHHHRRQLRRPHPQHHRRAVADQRRRAQQGDGAAQRHHGLAPRRPHMRVWRDRRHPGLHRRRPRLGESSRRCGGEEIRRRANRSPPRSKNGAGTKRAPPTCSTCASRRNTKPGIIRAPFPRPAGNWCRRPTSMPACWARASSSATTRKPAR